MRSSRFPIDELIVARLDTGDDLLLSIKQVAVEHAVTAAAFTLIGAIDRAKCGFYNPEKQGYDVVTWEAGLLRHKLLEIVACVGIVAQLDDDCHVHAHITLQGRPRGSDPAFTIGGHVMEGCRINPTAELTLIKARGTLTRHLDKTLNLALLSL